MCLLRHLEDDDDDDDDDDDVERLIEGFGMKRV